MLACQHEVEDPHDHRAGVLMLSAFTVRLYIAALMPWRAIRGATGSAEEGTHKMAIDTMPAGDRLQKAAARSVCAMP